MRRFINKIIDRIQRKRAIKNHRKMWHWLAENPTEGKLDYLLKYGGPLFNSCYLCEYAHRAKLRAGCGTFCKYCPLDWGTMFCCGNTRALYEKWQNEKFKKNPNEQRLKELALQIAELPEKVKK